MLDGENTKVGPKFSEKIVQQELELPRPPKGALLTILDQDINFLNEEITESTRWHYIVRDGVHRWIQHPRDVLRLANGVKFSWPALHGEIDPADLLAMEGLRLFDQAAFDWVRKNRDFLFSEGAFVMSHEKEDAALVEAFRESLPQESRQQILKLLSVLFPLNAKYFEGKDAIGGENRVQAGARRGVGSPAGYDAYFGLHPSADAIPKTIIDSIIRKASDRSTVVALIEPYLGVRDKSGKALIGLVLEELRFRFYGNERATPTSQLLQALFDIGERVLRTDSTPEAFSPSPQAHLNYLISEILACWSPEEAGAHLVDAFNDSTSGAFCAAVFGERARELGKLPDSSSSQPTIDEKHLAILGARLMELIDAAAADGSLRSAPAYWNIIESWKYLRGADEPKAWLSAGMTESAEFLATATMGLVSYSLSRPNRAYSVRVRPDETHCTIWKYFSLHAGSTWQEQSSTLTKGTALVWSRMRSTAYWWTTRKGLQIVRHERQRHDPTIDREVEPHLLTERGRQPYRAKNAGSIVNVEQGSPACASPSPALHYPPAHVFLGGRTMLLHRRKFLHLVTTAAAVPALPHAAFAQGAAPHPWPSQPLRIVVGFPAGGGADIVSRIMAQWLSQRLGQPVLIENKPGAATNISIQTVIAAPPDGYTLLFVAASAAVNATFLAPLPFDLTRDIAPVAAMIDFPLMLCVHPAVPAKTIAELIALAKAEPGKYSLASFGTGTSSHVAGQLFKDMAGITMTHVPYRGGAPMMTDLVGGQVSAAIAVLTDALPHIKSGSVRALATAGAKRVEVLPDVPAIGETVPLYVANSWCGIGAPKGTPAAVIERLNREINAGLADPAVRARLADVGTTPIPMAPAAFGDYVSAEIAKWGKVIKAAGIRPG